MKENQKGLKWREFYQNLGSYIINYILLYQKPGHHILKLYSHLAGFRYYYLLKSILPHDAVFHKTASVQYFK